MYCTKCSDTSPADAKFCISCGAVFEYTGRTKRLVQSDDIEDGIILGNLNRTLGDEPLYVTRVGFKRLLKNLNTLAYHSYTDIGPYIDNSFVERVIKSTDYYYMGRKIIIVAE